MLYVHKVRTRYIVRTASRELILGHIGEYNKNITEKRKKRLRNTFL